MAYTLPMSENETSKPFKGKQDPLLKALREKHPELDPLRKENEPLKIEGASESDQMLALETPRDKSRFVIQTVGIAYSVAPERRWFNGIL